MNARVLLIAAVLGLALATPCVAELGQAPFAVGFAVGVPQPESLAKTSEV